MRTARRTFIKHALAGSVTLTGLAGILRSRQAPAAIASDALRPMAPWGLQVGDVLAGTLGFTTRFLSALGM